MLVIGIDPGIATTGFGLIDETDADTLNVVEYGIIQTSASLLQGDRLLMLYRQLIELIDLHRPTSGAVEKLFFQRNVRTAMAVGEARGVILLALAQAGIPLVEYSPMEVKLAIAGHGGAGKKQIQQMVKALLNLSEIPKPDDAADALALAICHHNSKNYRSIVGTG